MLHRWLCEPLLQYFEIESRLDCTEALMRMQATNEALRDALGQIRDVERIASRISAGTVGPRELVSLRQSLEMLPTVKEILEPVKADMLAKLVGELDLLEDISSLIKNTISNDAPNSVKDGNVIAAGYSAELDRLRSIMNNGAAWLAQMEQTERDRTGIKGLKIRYNKVFGYYIDVTNS